MKPFLKQGFILVLIVLLFPHASLHAQFEDIGKILTWQKTSGGITGKTAIAYFRISVYDQNTIRIRVSMNKMMNDFSYTLVDPGIPDTAEFNVKDAGNNVLLSTQCIDVTIEKSPSFRIIFRNKSGIIINEDKPGKGFGTAFTGQRSTLYKVLQPDERFIGLGEVLGNLDKRGSAFTLNNTDTYRYGDPRLPMYSSIPFYMGITGSDVYGIFYHNSYSTFFNFGLSTPGYASITAQGGDVDYFFIYDQEIGGVLKHYTDLTGRMPLPPVWSLGYHQSRCSYYPQENVLMLAENFRKLHFPLDCIVLDADYLKDYEPFRINTERFPDMKDLTNKLAGMGIEVTASVNPGIKIDSTYEAYLDGLSEKVFLKYPDGSLYTSEIWPNLCHFPDFTSPVSRNWWSRQMKFLPDKGIHGFWNDMNEPAVGGSYLPDNLCFDFDGRRGNALEAKNLYGMLMARSSFESGLRYGHGRRPFILTRSGFAGVQRYSAMWTGDNTAKDEFLTGGVLLNTQMGLSGIAFVGDDIGGYIGPTSKELFIRWMQTGSFSPFMRNHKEAYSHANEPWSYGEEAEGISREFTEFRYRLLPYTYSIFYESSCSGMPVARSLAINNPHDPKVYHPVFQYQFLFGDAILVTPVTSRETSKIVYLPEGEWYDLYSDEKTTGKKEINMDCPLHKIPLFVRASSVIPMQSRIESTKEYPSDTLFLHLYFGNTGNIFEYYEDDGISFEYQSGVFYKRKISFLPPDRMIRLSVPEGSYHSKFRVVECILHGFPDDLKQINVDGRQMTLYEESSLIIDGLRYLEDLYIPEYYRSLRAAGNTGIQKSFSFENGNKEIKITW